MDNRIMDLTTDDNIIQEIASKGVTQINRLILFGGEPFFNTPSSTESRVGELCFEIGDKDKVKLTESK